MAAKMTDEAVTEWFGGLEFDGQREVLQQLQELHREAVEARKATLLAELQELGGIPATAKRTTRQGNRNSPKPKYRSRVNPELTWSGRGQKAKWLVAEMAETGLDADAFLIED
jgi:DNA-binding protein H-NS